MPGNKCNGNYNSGPGRVGRLVKIREQIKSSRASSDTVLINNNNNINSNNNNNVNNNYNDSDKHVVTDSFEHDQCFKEFNNSGASHVERFLEGAAAAKALSNGYEREDGKPVRQRLLVVANRLPVSAVRKGEDTWSLEISAGGLVSALLGMRRWSFFLNICSLYFSSFSVLSDLKFA
jgi:trehalose 6-phosphate synthase/phosphatase